MYIFSNSEVHLKWIFWIYVFMFKLRSILQVDFLNWCIYFQIQKYTWSRFLNLYIYVQTLKYTWSRFSILIYLFMKLKSILEVDFSNLCIYVQIKKYTWKKFSKLNSCIYMFKLRYIFEADFLNTIFLFKVRSILEAYFTSTEDKKYKWIITEVQTKYLFILTFSCFYT